MSEQGVRRKSNAEIEAESSAVADTLKTKASLKADKVFPAGNVWLNLVGNDMVLPPGEWLLFGLAEFEVNAGNPNWNNVAVMWASANGDDTGSTPARLITAPGISEVLGEPDGGFLQYFDSNEQIDNHIRFAAPSVRIIVTTTTTVYLVPFGNGSPATNGRGRVSGFAQKVGEAA